MNDDEREMGVKISAGLGGLIILSMVAIMAWGLIVLFSGGLPPEPPAVAEAQP